MFGIICEAVQVHGISLADATKMQGRVLDARHPHLSVYLAHIDWSSNQRVASAMLAFTLTRSRIWSLNYSLTHTSIDNHLSFGDHSFSTFLTTYENSGSSRRCACRRILVQITPLRCQEIEVRHGPYATIANHRPLSTTEIYRKPACADGERQHSRHPLANLPPHSDEDKAPCAPWPVRVGYEFRGPASCIGEFGDMTSMLCYRGRQR
ncbi:hypothetical protein M011DRAFT_342454 [Sporormia fimetaria CBS 119925]|uniref:Uncharacterized protein n=1 Tax=Sporormia fimetaria CBS 119925 TaxID=1340428 RepID=A0A6A6VEQ3_9PLEO|nr:hypothetical protein M011DRAFT_342454 [Sporormia fimetaria CBS 119925]